MGRSQGKTKKISSKTTTRSAKQSPSSDKKAWRKPRKDDVSNWEEDPEYAGLYGGVSIERGVANESSDIDPVAVRMYYRVVIAGQKTKHFFGETAHQDAERYARDNQVAPSNDWF